MPYPFQKVTMFYLGYIPRAGALMVSTDLPPETVYWLPDSLAEVSRSDRDLGKRLDMKVSTWWLYKQSLMHLIKPDTTGADND